MVAALAMVAVALPGGTWGVAQAQAVAAKVWRQPCGGNVQITRKRLPYRALEYAIREVDETGLHCTIEFTTRRRILAGWLSRWVDLCSVMVHGYGHLAGFRDPVTGDVHSSNPRSVMWPTYDPDRPDRPDRRCRGHGWPYLLAYRLPH